MKLPKSLTGAAAALSLVATPAMAESQYCAANRVAAENAARAHINTNSAAAPAMNGAAVGGGCWLLSVLVLGMDGGTMSFVCAAAGAAAALGSAQSAEAAAPGEATRVFYANIDPICRPNYPYFRTTRP